MPIRRLLSVFTLCLAGGCTALAEPIPLDTFYRQANLQSQRFDTAVELWQRGESTTAQTVAERDAALAALQNATERCAQQTGCDLRRFLSTYNDLLTRHSIRPARIDEGLNAAPEKSLLQKNGNALLLMELPEAERSLNLLKGRELADVIAVNGPVKAALNEWLTWMRPQLIEAWENYQYLRSQMWPVYQKAGLPEALLFGILAKESGGKVHAVSRSGAAGLLQFMPATGKYFGLGRDTDGFDTRFDPRQATRANVRYLNARFAELNNDLALTLAAYNGGEGRVLRLFKQSRHASFWDPALNSKLPSETRDYVPMVLAAAWLFLHPGDYGLQFPEVSDSTPTKLTLTRSASLNALAICLGDTGSRNGWFRSLRNLNPRYEAHTLIPDRAVLRVPKAVLPLYAKHCADGDRLARALDLASAAKHHPSSTLVSSYTVRSGDNLAAIARRHRCSSQLTLAQVNNIKGPQYLIKAGQVLRLQGCTG